MNFRNIFTLRPSRREFRMKAIIEYSRSSPTTQTSFQIEQLSCTCSWLSIQEKYPVNNEQVHLLERGNHLLFILPAVHRVSKVVKRF